MNLAVICGVLSRPAELRTLKSGDRLLALEVTVREEGRPTSSVPVSWPDPPAKAEAWSTGAELVVVGRVHRRFFQAGGATASRTEVVAEAVVPVSQRARVARALAGAGAVLSAAPG